MVKVFRKLFFAAILVGLFIAMPVKAETAQELRSQIQAVELELEKLQIETAVSKVNPAVVSITVYKPNVLDRVIPHDSPNKRIKRITYETLAGPELQKVRSGTGFFITPDGYLLTNRHVAVEKNAMYVITLASGETTQAHVIHQDPKVDVAILKADGGNYVPVDLGDSDTLQLTQTVLALGNANGRNRNLASAGSITQLQRKIIANDSAGGKLTIENTIQTTVPVKRGYSGAPLFDFDGSVLGIMTATVSNSSSAISFALPINQIKPILSSVLGIQ